MSAVPRSADVTTCPAGTERTTVRTDVASLLAGVDPSIPVDRMWSEPRRARYAETLDWKPDYPAWTRSDVVDAVGQVFTVVDLDDAVMASIYDSGLVQVANAMSWSNQIEKASRFLDNMVSAMPLKFKEKSYNETHQIAVVGLQRRVPDDAVERAAPAVLVAVETFYDDRDEKLNERDLQLVERAVTEYGAVWDAWHMERHRDAAHAQPNPVTSFKILTTAAFHHLRPSRRAAMDLAVLLVGFACHYQDQRSRAEGYDCATETTAELNKRGLGDAQAGSYLFGTDANLKQLAEWPADDDAPASFTPEERERLLALRRTADVASKLSFLYADKPADDAGAAAVVALCRKAELMVTKPFGADGAPTLWHRADLGIDALEEQGVLAPNADADDGRTDAERVYALVNKRAAPPLDGGGAEGDGKRARIAASVAIRASAHCVFGAAAAAVVFARCLEE